MSRMLFMVQVNALKHKNCCFCRVSNDNYVLNEKSSFPGTSFSKTSLKSAWVV